ncbi:hypothetical protein ACLUEY_06785 [Vreelandella aquamarina]
MPRVIYLGLQAFANEPQELLPTAESPLALATLSSDENETPLSHDGPLLLQHLTQDDQRLLNDWLKQDKKRELTIAWPQPQRWLAARLSQGAALEATLDEWQQQGKVLLQLFRAARRQVRLVGYIPGSPMETLASPAAGEPLLPVYQLAAAQLLGQHAMVQEVHDYLQASSQESHDEPLESHALVEAVLKNHDQQHQAEKEKQQYREKLQHAETERDRQQQELSRLKGELQRARDDQAHYLAQLQKVQTSLEESNSEKQTLTRQIEEQSVSVSESRRLLEQANTELTDVKEENSLLLEQLHSVQEVFEIQVNKLSDIQRHEEQQRKTAEQYQHKLLKSEKENSLLLTQLQSVQEALERRINEQHEEQKKLKENQHKAAEKNHQQITELEEEKALLLQQLQVVQETYEVLLNDSKALDRVQKETILCLEQKNEEQETVSSKAIQQLEKERDEQKAISATHQGNHDAVVNKLEQRVAELHKTQELLEKSALDHVQLRQQLEKRQKELNMLRNSSQQHIHHLERLVQWLRVHAQRHAAAAYREIRSYKKTLPKQAAMLEASQFFDADWYREQYPDVAQAGLRPAEHFIKFGAIDGRDPGPLFSTDFYLTYYEDVAASGQHPLLHYLRHGVTEQRETRPEQRHLPAPKTLAEEGK